jgi:RND family efflux transporter MFP subunit
VEKVASARAALTLARNRLDYAELRAPSDGVVTSVLTDPGTVVSEGQPALRLAESGEAEAEVALPEAAVADARDHATVTFWARPDVVLNAHLRELSPSADAKLRTYTARYTLEGAPDWVAYGMTATVRLDAPGAEAVAALPAAALTDCGKGPMVWVVSPDGGTPEPRPVSVRSLRQDRALVSGLKDGELVVALGVQKLDPAARVRVADIRSMPE